MFGLGVVMAVAFLFRKDSPSTGSQPSGMRIVAVESGTTTTSLSRGVNVIYDKQVSGGITTISDYAYAQGVLIGKVSGGNVLYDHQDHLGNTRLVTKGSNGSTDFSTNYQPYGPQYASSGNDPVCKYTEKPHSPATGLYYYGARWSSPVSTMTPIRYDPLMKTQRKPVLLISSAWVNDCLAIIESLFSS
jgi:hypothetical protein